MSLPTLTTAGAVYRAAFRAQDASVNGSDEVITIPGLISGVDLTPRYWNGSSWDNTATANVVRNATGIDSGPGIVSQGAAGCFTTAASLVGIGEGNHYWTTFIRNVMTASDWFMGICGFEAWVANECAYCECGGAEMLQLDRGSSRRNRGPALFDTNPHTIKVEAYTLGDLNAYLDGSGVAQGNLSYAGPITPGTLSAWMVGPVERTASADFPPGVFTYTQTTIWSRTVVVETVGGFLNSTDQANLALWIDGQDFTSNNIQVLFWMGR